jgi:Flp pilus assembly protein TadB
MGVYEIHELARILVPLACLGTIALVTIAIVWFRFRKYKAIHEFARILAEKGAPVPQELLKLLNRRAVQSSHTVLRSGLVFLAIGIGAMIYLFIEDHNKWSLALIPSLVGIALLVSWAVENRKTGRS